MSAQNRPTAEQLAALTTGDTVTIESGAAFSRRHDRTGRVVRIDPSHIVINPKGPRGGSLIEPEHAPEGEQATDRRGA